MGVNSLPKTVTRQRRDCDLNSGPSAPESSTLTTRLPSHHRWAYISIKHLKQKHERSHIVLFAVCGEKQAITDYEACFVRIVGYIGQATRKE